MIKKFINQITHNSVIRVIHVYFFVILIAAIQLYFMQTTITTYKSFLITKEIGNLQFKNIRTIVTKDIETFVKFTFDYQYWNEMYSVVIDDGIIKKQNYIDIIKRDLISVNNKERYNILSCIVICMYYSMYIYMTNGTYMCQPNCWNVLYYITNNWASEGIRLTLAQ